MKTKFKTSTENNYKFKIKTLLKNNNFRNNQNYVLDFSKKKNILDYGYTIKRKKTLFQTKQYFLKNIKTNRYKTAKLYKGNFGYIIKPSGIYKFKINILSNIFFIIAFLSILQLLGLLFFGGNFIETITHNGISETKNIILNNLTFFERLKDIKSFLILPLIFLSIGIIKKFIIYNEEDKYLIFIEKINSNKIIIYKNK